MAKWRNYRKHSNIEQYVLVFKDTRLTWGDLPTSDVTKEIDGLIDLAISKGIKHPYMRFMAARGTWLKFIFYTDSKSATPKHLDKMQTLESLREYLNTL